jgi:hypothetical protein
MWMITIGNKFKFVISMFADFKIMEHLDCSQAV